jgi:hypothetical protein
LPRLKVFSIIVCTLFLLQILVLQPRIFAEPPDPTQQTVDGNVVTENLEGDISDGNVEVESAEENLSIGNEEEESIPEDSLDATENVEAESVEGTIAPISIMPMAISTPGNYQVNPDAIVVPTTIEDTSTNDHTMSTLLWSFEDTVYTAVKSTHKLQYMTLNGMTSFGFDEYNPWVNIKVGDTPYEPVGLNGNTDSSHWTVFKFGLADLNMVGHEKVSFFIKGIGGGHDVGGNLLLTIPRIDVTGNKVWVGGTTRSQITLQLKAQVNNGPLTVIASGVVNGTENPTWTYKWESVPKYDPYGRLYTSISVDEETVPPNYVKSLDGLTVTNTYSPVQINIEVNKVWVGPTKESITVKLLANGEDTGKTLELNGTNGWSGSFTVNQYDDSGKEISYTVKEAEVPYGYQVSYSSDNGRLIVTNMAIKGGAVTAIYVDEAGSEISEPLVETGFVGEIYTTEQKEITGYEFKEIRDDSAPATGEFKIEPQSVIYVYKQKMGSLTITKVDAEQNDNVLEGAVFQLYDSENNLIGTKTTDSNGQILFEGLEWGTYTLLETKAPAGYRMLTEKITVEISKVDLHQAKTVENTQVDWEIPRTGGVGSLGFFGLGGLLMGSALLWYLFGKTPTIKIRR